MSLYEQINEEELLCKDITFPQFFPAIYIDENDKIYCYMGVLDNHRVHFRSSPYYLKDKKPNEVTNLIRGYFRIENGAVIIDKEFMDKKHPFDENAKCKLLKAGVIFPRPNDMSFRIRSSYDNLEDELTRKVFILTYNELNELLYHFNQVFAISNINIYNKYPSITRSMKNDNYCDLNDLWIPAEYPYIAFDESSYYYSHVSIYSFYEIIKFLTKYSLKSRLAKTMIENGLNIEILERLFKHNYYIDYNSSLVTRKYHYYLENEDK